LIQYTVDGLDDDYETFITAATGSSCVALASLFASESFLCSLPTVCADVSPLPKLFANCPGHATPYCLRYFPVAASSTSPSEPPTLTTIQTSEANDVLWYRDSTPPLI